MNLMHYIHSSSIDQSAEQLCNEKQYKYEGCFCIVSFWNFGPINFSVSIGNWKGNRKYDPKNDNMEAVFCNDVRLIHNDKNHGSYEDLVTSHRDYYLYSCSSKNCSSKNGDCITNSECMKGLKENSVYSSLTEDQNKAICARGKDKSNETQPIIKKTIITKEQYNVLSAAIKKYKETNKEVFEEEKEVFKVIEESRQLIENKNRRQKQIKEEAKSSSRKKCISIVFVVGVIIAIIIWVVVITSSSKYIQQHSTR